MDITKKKDKKIRSVIGPGKGMGDTSGTCKVACFHMTPGYD